MPCATVSLADVQTSTNIHLHVSVSSFFLADINVANVPFVISKLYFILSLGRGRRRDHRMLALMVMGFMIMASILIPTGFQFLTVLGGKSLLMAKMALIMSAISGLKKIATSNVGYGFYHTGTNDGHHHDHVHHGFHDKLYQGNAQQGGSYPGVGL